MRTTVGLAAAALVLAGCGTSSTPPPPSAAASATTSAPSSAPPSSSRPTAAPPSTAATAVTSEVYGYRAEVPADWSVTPATVAWDGGDIDHTAAYADYLVDGSGNEYFVVGAPANATVPQVVDEHVAWLSENRGCPGPSLRRDITIDGLAAERLAIHCPEGVFGPTLVSKAITVRDGQAVIVSSFSPDDGSDEFAPFDALVSSIRWTDS